MNDLILKAFNKVDESTSPENLEKNVLAKMLNMVLSKKNFNPMKRHGFTRFNTNEVDITGVVKSVFDVVDSAGSNFLLASITTALRKSADGTGVWSTVKGGLSSDKKHKIVSYGGRLIITNGTDPVYILGSTGFSGNWNLEIPKPDILTVTSAHASFGDLEDSSRYKYILVYVTKFGEWSHPSMPFTHYLNDNTADSTDVTYNQLRFDNLPVSIDSRVKYKLLFRTLKDSEIYFYHSKLSNATTYFIDNKADTFLDLSKSIYFMNIPVYAKNICIHRDRLFAANFRERYKSYYPPAHSKTAVTPPGGWTNGVQLNIVSGTGGDMTPGNYQYLFINVDDIGRESDPVIAAVTIQEGHGGVTIYNVPAWSNMFDNGIEKLRIYRTKCNGVNFFFNMDYPVDSFTADGPGSRSTFDSMSDDSLGAAYDLPVNENRSGILYSEIEKPSELRAANYFSVFPDDGDEITAIFDDGDGLMVFKKYSIYKVYTGGSPLNWFTRKLIEDIGCTEPDAITKNGSEYFFISNNMAYILNGESIRRVSDDYKNSFDEVTVFNSATFIPASGWYVLGVKVSSNSYLYCYDTKLQCWYTFSISSSEAVLIKRHGTYSGDLLIGDNLYIVKYDKSVYTDNEDGVQTLEFSSLLRTKTFTFPDGISCARLRKFYCNYDKVNETKFTLKDPDTGKINEFIDGVSTGWKLFKKDFGNWTTNELFKTPKFYLEISGGIKEFGSCKVKYRTVKEGTAQVGTIETEAVKDDLGRTITDDKGVVLK